MDAPLLPSHAKDLATLPPGLSITEREADITSPVQESPQRTSPLSPMSRRFTAMTAVTDVGDWSILKRQTKIVALTTAVPTFQILAGLPSSEPNSTAGSIKDVELGAVQAEAIAPPPQHTKRQITAAAVLIILVPGALAAIITILILLLAH